MQNGKKSGRKKLVWIIILLLIIGIAAAVYMHLGKTPAVDDVAEADPNAGLIEAWNGETDAVTEDLMEDLMEEETPSGPHTERVDRFDENGTLVGYDVVDYDAQDRVVREELFDLNGQSEMRWERSYSEDGREETVLIYDYDVLSMKMHTLYDENGNTIEMRHYDAAGRLFSVYNYDEKGNLVSGSGYAGEPGEERKTEERTYDANGAVTEAILYNPDGSIYMTTLSEFDELGRQTRFARKDGSGVFLADHRYVYDENGVHYRTEYYNENGEMRDYEDRVFDAEGRVVKRSEYEPDGTLKRYETMAYTVFGKIERAENYDGSDTLIEYSVYSYDENARMQRSELYNGSGELTEYRRFTYNDDGTYIEYICEPTGEVMETRKYSPDGDILS